MPPRGHYIACKRRYQVNVQMRNGLSGCRAVVDANVEPVGLHRCERICLGVVQKSQKVIALFSIHVEERTDMALGDDETVSGEMKNPSGIHMACRFLPWMQQAGISQNG